MNCLSFRNIISENKSTPELEQHLIQCNDCRAYRKNLEIITAAATKGKPEVPEYLNSSVRCAADKHLKHIRKIVLVRFISTALAASIMLFAGAVSYLKIFENKLEMNLKIENIVDNMYSYNDYTDFNKRINAVLSTMNNKNTLTLAMEQEFQMY